MVYNKDAIKKALAEGKSYEDLRAEMLEALTEAHNEHEEEAVKKDLIADRRTLAVQALIDYFEAIAGDEFNEDEVTVLTDAIESLLKASESPKGTSYRWHWNW